MTSIFINTYQLYKKQTDQLAQWLLDTAVDFGYSLKDEPPENANQTMPESTVAQPATSARVKGKKRKEGREKLKEKPVTDSFRNGRPNSIRLSQFVELATAIVERAGGNVKIPTTIIGLVQQIISMRRSVSKYYKMRSRSQVDDYNLRGDNYKHSHFISKLEDVLDILKSVAEPPTHSTTKPQVETGSASERLEETSVDDMSNRFSTLEVEEPIELGLNDGNGNGGSSLQPETSLANNSKNVVYDASESADDEIDFAIFCFFEDLRRIRMFLTKIWQNYKSGKIDLMTASVVSNTAFGFAQNVDVEFGRIYPALSLSQFHDNPIFPTYMLNCMKTGVDFNFRIHSDDLYNYEMQEIGEFIFLPVYLLLEAFSRVLRPKQIPIAKKGYYGIYNPKSNREKMSYRQKMAEDKIILLEMLPMYCVLGQGKHGVFAVDELTNGLANLYRKKEIPAWLVFATQVFLDITHIMRDRVGDAYLHIKRTAILTKINMSRVLDSPLHTVNWPKQNQKHTKEIWDFAHEWIITDGFEKLGQAFYSSQSSSYQSETFGLLKSHPLFCGTIETSLILLNSEIGVTLSMAWGTILYVGHLYNALRQSRVIELEWPDMELFISIQTAKRLFVGDLPTTIEDCNKRYELMMGIGLKNFAKNKRNPGSGKIVHSKSGPRNWQTDSPIIRTIKERYVSQRGSIAWSVQNIEDILNEASQQSLPQHLRNRWSRSHHLGQLQVLELLRSALISEYKALRYDYISMHFRCLDFLRALQVELDEDLKTQFGPGYLEREDQLSNLVGYVLMAAVSFERATAGVKDPRGLNIANCTLFSKSGALLTGLIVKSGDLESKKLLQG